MKIAIMSTWNEVCGIFTHALLISKEWQKMGHEIVVFAPVDERVKGRNPIDKEDESFVYRNWEMYRYGDRIVDDNVLDLYFDPKPILNEDFDLFVIEKPTSAPLGKLAKIIGEIKRKGPIVAIIHEGRPIKNKNFYKIKFDIYTLFDNRFLKLFKDTFPRERTFIIPFPTHPVFTGDKREARRSLGLPDDDIRIILTFGMRLHDLWEIMPAIDEISKEFDILLLMLSKHSKSVNSAIDIVRKYKFAQFRNEAPAIERLYKYLHASDALNLHRKSKRDHIAVSSTVHLCLGALTPITCPDNDYFETYEDEIIKYSNVNELKSKLRMILMDVGLNKLRESMKKFIEKNSAEKVARKILSLVNSV